MFQNSLPWRDFGSFDARQRHREDCPDERLADRGNTIRARLDTLGDGFLTDLYAYRPTE